LEKPPDEAEGNGEITDQIANQGLASKVTVGFIVVWTRDERSLTDYPVELRVRSSCRISSHNVLSMSLENFRFWDENHYEYEISFKAFSRIVKQNTPRNSSLYFFSPEKLALLSLLKEVTTSPYCKMLKLLTFDNLFSPLRHSR